MLVMSFSSFDIEPDIAQFGVTEDESVAIDTSCGDTEVGEHAAIHTPEEAEAGPAKMPELDEFIAEALVTPDRAYIAQWDSQITAFVRDTE